MPPSRRLLVAGVLFISSSLLLLLSRLEASTSSEVLSRLPKWSSWNSSRSYRESVETLDRDGMRYLDDRRYRTAIEQGKLEHGDALHPIVDLIAEAKLAWDQKVARQSGTLAEAAKEYHRRYGRAPPKGFDVWWEWATKNSVKLVDEYDSIYSHFEPFFALHPTLLRKRVSELMSGNSHWEAQLFGVVIKDGVPTIRGGPATGRDRMDDMIELLVPICHLLPDMELAISWQDLPAISVSSTNREKHVKAARANEFLDNAQAEDPMHTLGLRLTWAETCPADSAIRRQMEGLEIHDDFPTGSGFITEHLPTMDVCQHPNIHQMNGFLASWYPQAQLFYPLFTLSRYTGFAELPIVSLSQYKSHAATDPAWEEKTRSDLVWRGSTTGVSFRIKTNWRQSQRTRLVRYTNEEHGYRTVRWADGDKLQYFQAPTPQVNSRYYDVGFVNKAVQCDNADGTCDFVTKSYAFKPPVSVTAANLHKYVLDVDGNGWSGRFHRLMSTRAVVLKSTIFPEWWAERIQPWYHYVPVRVDLHDLDDIMAFFTGTLEGAGAHDDEGKLIGEQGQVWAQEYWRVEDMRAYLLRLLLEYARLIYRNEENLSRMDFVMPS